MVDTQLFSRRIREAREQKGLKQKDVAETLGISPQTVNAYEKSGKTPTLENAVALAETLDVSLDWLLGLSDTNEIEISNLADIVLLIEKISDCTPLDVFYTDVTYETNDEDSKILSVHSSSFDLSAEGDSQMFVGAKTHIETIIRLRDGRLAPFFQKREKMRRLLSDHTINEDLYQTWLIGETERLKKILVSDYHPFYEVRVSLDDL